MKNEDKAHRLVSILAFNPKAGQKLMKQERTAILKLAVSFTSPGSPTRNALVLELKVRRAKLEPAWRLK